MARVGCFGGCQCRAAINELSAELLSKSLVTLEYALGSVSTP